MTLIKYELNIPKYIDRNRNKNVQNVLGSTLKYNSNAQTLTIWMLGLY